MDIHEAISKHEDAEFEYGVLDCCLFVCAVLQDITGRDYAARWRGRYSTELGAFRLIKKHGDLSGIASAAFGKKKSILFVKPGNPVLLPRELVEHDSIGEALGIYDGEHIVYMTEKGLDRSPITVGRGCWNV